jgi:hypothetical protein
MVSCCRAGGTGLASFSSGQAGAGLGAQPLLDGPAWRAPGDLDASTISFCGVRSASQAAPKAARLWKQSKGGPALQLRIGTVGPINRKEWMVGPNGLEPLTSTVSKRQRRTQAKSKNSGGSSVYAGVARFFCFGANAAKCSIVTPNQGGYVTNHVTKSLREPSGRLRRESLLVPLDVLSTLNLSRAERAVSHSRRVPGLGNSMKEAIWLILRHGWQP